MVSLVVSFCKGGSFFFMRFFKRLLVLCLVLMCVLCLGVQGLAVDANSRTGQVNVSAVVESNVALPDTKCSVYYIADLSGVFDDRFVEYRFNLVPDNLNDVAVLANALEGVIIRDSILADFVGYTNVQGQCVFAGLTPGVWLLSCEDSQIDNIVYHAQPSLFVVYPGDVLDLEVKHVAERLPQPEQPSDETTIQKVLKRWCDDNNLGRPTYVYVELLRNGVVYDRVRLDASNGWRYTWTGLDKYARWSIVEVDTDDDYICDITQFGVTTVLTNMLVPDEPPETPPDNPPEIPPENPPGNPPGNPPESPPETPPDNPPENPPGIPPETSSETSSENPPDNPPETSDESTVPETPNTPTGSKIPQTGENQYLAPIFACAGLGFLLVGMFMRGRSSDEDEDL